MDSLRRMMGKDSFYGASCINPTQRAACSDSLLSELRHLCGMSLLSASILRISSLLFSATESGVTLPAAAGIFPFRRCTLWLCLVLQGCDAFQVALCLPHSRFPSSPDATSCISKSALVWSGLHRNCSISARILSAVPQDGKILLVPLLRGRLLCLEDGLDPKEFFSILLP